jgi:glycosyltransferase involved in cell wall biosynthesis
VYSRIDAQIFRFRNLHEKRLLVALVPKATGSLLTVFHLLRSRAAQRLNRAGECEWTVLENKTQAEVASCLEEALILIFLSTEEGLPRLLLEAMACGCLVAANRTQPLSEILPPEYMFEPGRLTDLAVHIESVLTAFPSELGRWRPVVSAGRAKAEEFSYQRQLRSILDAWTEIIERDRITSKG